MRKLFALLVLTLLTAGLVAAPSAEASTIRWYQCYDNGTDGCIVHNVYSNSGWHAGTSTDGGNWMAFQSDCNLVIYSKVNGVYRAAWASGTVRVGTLCRIIWQADGNVVMYASYPPSWVAIWNTHTNYGPGWRYEMQLWSDNCLRVLQVYTVRWTDGHC